MTYVTYTTDALVCGAINRNTADRSFLLFTREAGMLFAEAKSVREERSKQRYALQEFSQIRVSLVKGRQSWKVGSVEASVNDYVRSTTREARGSIALVYKTLRRFIHGEEASPELFDFVIEALAVLSGPVLERSFVELCVQVRIMAYLGYVNTAALPKAVRELPIESFVTLQSDENTALLSRLLEQATLNSQL